MLCKRVECLLGVGNEWRALSISGSCSEQTGEWSRRWTGVVSAVMGTMCQVVVVKRAGRESQAANLLVSLHSHPHL